MRILVTGASGFVGGHTVNGLVADGHTVAALIRPSTDAARFPRGAQVLTHDGSIGQLLELVGHFKPEATIHLATYFVAEHSIADVNRLAEANLSFGMQLLQTLAMVKCPLLINFGTAWEHFETDAYRPVSLYAATKHAFEKICAYYVDNRDFGVITLKLSDTYGPNDGRLKLIPLLTRIALTGEELALSPGAQTVNYAHIDDVVDAIRVALGRIGLVKPGVMETFSVRGPEQMTLREFVELFAAVAGKPLNVVWGGKPYRKREVMHPWLGALPPGWSPRIPLEQGLRRMLTNV